MIDPDLIIPGTLHVYIAFDWGNEIRLDEARRLWPARSGELARRPRTPSSISYRPTPLQFSLTPLQLDLPELGQVTAAVEATALRFRRGECRATFAIQTQCGGPASIGRLAGRAGAAGSGCGRRQPELVRYAVASHSAAAKSGSDRRVLRVPSCA